MPAQTEMKPVSTKSCAKDVCVLVEFNWYCQISLLRGHRPAGVRRYKNLYMVQSEEMLVCHHKQGGCITSGGGNVKETTHKCFCKEHY